MEMVQDSLPATLHLDIRRGRGHLLLPHENRLLVLFKYILVTELLSKSKHTIVYYISVEKLKKPPYRKNLRVKNFQLKKKNGFSILSVE